MLRLQRVSESISPCLGILMSVWWWGILSLRGAGRNPFFPVNLSIYPPWPSDPLSQCKKSYTSHDCLLCSVWLMFSSRHLSGITIHATVCTIEHTTWSQFADKKPHSKNLWLLSWFVGSMLRKFKFFTCQCRSQKIKTLRIAWKAH